MKLKKFNNFMDNPSRNRSDNHSSYLSVEQIQDHANATSQTNLAVFASLLEDEIAESKIMNDEIYASLHEENARLRDALQEIINQQPCCEGGGCFYPMHDGEGNYIGEQNVDPLSVIQGMSETAQNSLQPNVKMSCRPLEPACGSGMFVIEESLNSPANPNCGRLAPSSCSIPLPLYFVGHPDGSFSVANPQPTIPSISCSQDTKEAASVLPPESASADGDSGEGAYVRQQ